MQWIVIYRLDSTVQPLNNLERVSSCLLKLYHIWSGIFFGCCILGNSLELRLKFAKTYGVRSFSIAASTLWKTLLSNVTNGSSVSIFKSRRKTFPFKKAFLYFYYFVALVKHLFTLRILVLHKNININILLLLLLLYRL